jgi:hypothetical protein
VKLHLHDNYLAKFSFFEGIFSLLKELNIQLKHSSPDVTYMWQTKNNRTILEKGLIERMQKWGSEKIIIHK